MEYIVGVGGVHDIDGEDNDDKQLCVCNGGGWLR